MPALSLVVVTWNSRDDLSVLLTSVARHLPDAEVVVVDNASEDGTAAFADESPVVTRTIALDENVGFGAANNAGVAAAGAERVVLLNPDTELVDDSLRALAALAESLRALCGPELLNPDGSRQPSASPLPGGWEVGVDALWPAALMPEALRVRCEPWRAPTTRRVGWLTGACIAAPRDVLLRLGPFDPSVHMFAEDMDLGLRAAAAGVDRVYAPDVARVIHVGRTAAERRFADAGMRLEVENRQRVAAGHLGRARARYDHASQVAFYGTRFVAKRALGRDPRRERDWLAAAFRRT